MKSTRAMHDAAVAAAVKAGPRMITVKGEAYAVFKLTYDELRRLFIEHGYNPERITWRKIIAQWGDEELWGEVIPNNVMKKDSVGWSVIFCTISMSDLQRLRRYAEDHNVRAVPWDAKEAMQVCQSSS